MRCYVPAAICLIGMLTCAWRVGRKPAVVPTGKVEIIVHGPDGTTIPAVRRAPH